MEKERYLKYVEICERAERMKIDTGDRMGALMDIESADKKFNMRLDDWLQADDFNFAHDYCGIKTWWDLRRANISKSSRGGRKHLFQSFLYKLQYFGIVFLLRQFLGNLLMVLYILILLFYRPKADRKCIGSTMV